jgi:hypothetical protein
MKRRDEELAKCEQMIIVCAISLGICFVAGTIAIVVFLG